MIIRCDQCKTRFRLDDSKVTVSGVRVRCSKCKHTFVVRKEAEEEESLMEEIRQDKKSTPAEEYKQEEDNTGVVAEQAETGQMSNEISLPQDNVAVAGKDLADGSTFDKSPSIEDDFFPFKAVGQDAGSAPTHEEPAEEQSPFQWPAEDEAEEHHEWKDDDFQFAVKSEAGDDETTFRESEDFSELGSKHNTRPDEAAEGVAAESPIQVRLSGTDRDEDLEVFLADIGHKPDACGTGSADDFSLGEVGKVGPDDQLPIEKDHIDIGTGAEDIALTDEASDFSEVADVKFTEKNELETVPLSFDNGVEGEPSSHHSAIGAEEDLPPLSITSRRKRSISLTKVLAGILSLVVLIVLGGVFFFGTDLTAVKVPSFSDIKNRLITGQWKNTEISIKNLDGAFVRNNHGVDLFVIRGEAFNKSDRASSTVRIQGYIYGKQGQILSSMPARFGEVLSDDRLAVLPVNEIEALSGNKSGSVSRDMVMQPGKGVPFQIVFGHVPEGAGEFGAEVIDSATGAP